MGVGERRFIRTTAAQGEEVAQGAGRQRLPPLAALGDPGRGPRVKEGEGEGRKKGEGELALRFNQ